MHLGIMPPAKPARAAHFGIRHGAIDGCIAINALFARWRFADAALRHVGGNALIFQRQALKKARDIPLARLQRLIDEPRQRDIDMYFVLPWTARTLVDGHTLLLSSSPTCDVGLPAFMRVRVPVGRHPDWCPSKMPHLHGRRAIFCCLSG